MKKNMGAADRISRIIVAVIVGYLYYNGNISGTVGIILLTLAVVFLLTSFIGLCPLYLLCGINSCRTPRG